jgi:hypothetical protein
MDPSSGHRRRLTFRAGIPPWWDTSAAPAHHIIVMPLTEKPWLFILPNQDKP